MPSQRSLDLEGFRASGWTRPECRPRDLPCSYCRLLELVPFAVSVVTQLVFRCSGIGVSYPHVRIVGQVCISGVSSQQRLEEIVIRVAHSQHQHSHQSVEAHLCTSFS